MRTDAPAEMGTRVAAPTIRAKFGLSEEHAWDVAGP